MAVPLSSDLVKLVMGIALGVLMLAGCQGDGPSGPQGSPADVKTQPGRYDGYQILADCQLPSIDYGVLGTGSLWYADIAPGNSGRMEALVELANAVFKPALAEISSVDGVGVGTSCSLNAGVGLFMSDWRDVDGVFMHVGRVLLERGLREEISLHVTVAEPD